MRLTLIALAALAAAGAAPAAACDIFSCAERALSEDSYPLGTTPLPPHVHAMVEERNGRGLSLAGFYNDPSVALAARDYAPADVEPQPAAVEYDYREHHHAHGPHVIMSPYGHGRHYARHESPEPEGRHVY